MEKPPDKDIESLRICLLSNFVNRPINIDLLSGKATRKQVNKIKKVISEETNFLKSEIKVIFNSTEQVIKIKNICSVTFS